MEGLESRVDDLEESGVGSIKSVLNVLDVSNTLSGKTVTVSINGGETLTGTIHNGSAQFRLSYIGNYTITCDRLSQVIANEALGSVYNVDIQPSWMVWCNEGNVDDSFYDSLDELLEDEIAIRKLMTIHASVDYLAEVSVDIPFLTKIVNNDLCAKWINLRDYALDKLYASERVSPLMDEADKYFYGEWTLMPQVPTITSNTGPYGEVIADSYYYTYYMYNAFDNSDSTYWTSGNFTGQTNVGAWIGYKFTLPVCITQVDIKIKYDSSYVRIPIDFKVQGSNDENTWVDISGTFNLNTYDLTRFKFKNETKYERYRVYIINQTHTSTQVGEIATLQFYAWAPRGNVPVMTSNTVPYGEASASSYYSTYYPWVAFNNNYSDYCHPNLNDTVENYYLRYKFTNPVCVKKARWVGNTYGANKGNIYFDVAIQGSNDGNTWTTISNTKRLEGIKFPNMEIKDIDASDNDNYYLYYQMVIVESNDTVTCVSGDAFSTNELQFYGRELKISVPTMTSDSTPYGQVVGGVQFFDTHYYWLAYDNNDSTYADVNGGYNTANPVWLGYKFDQPTRVKFFKLRFTLNEQIGVAGRTFILQGSNDGTTWEDVANTYAFGSDSSYTFVENVDNENSYIYYRTYFPQGCSRGSNNCYYTYWNTLQFYGVDYSEYDWDSVTPRTYIYDHGVELKEMDLTGYTQPDAKGGTGTRTKLDGSINIHVDNSSNNNPSCAIIGVSNPIDLTNYSVIKSVVRINKYEFLNQCFGILKNTKTIGTWSSSVPASTSYIEGGTIMSYKQLVCNITSFTGEYYIFDRVYPSQSSVNRAQDHDLIEMWLE